MKVVCHKCGCEQEQPRDPFCRECDADLRPFVEVEVYENSGYDPKDDYRK